MPLALDMIEEKGQTTGKLIIDRNLIQFTFPKKDGDVAAERRNFITYIIDELEDQLISDGLSIADNDGILAESTDPRHEVLGHIGSYDRHTTFHHHIELTNVVTYRDVETLFNNFDDSDYVNEINMLMSPECREQALIIIREHLLELEQPSGRLAEEEYKHQKANDLTKATLSDVESESDLESDLESESDLDYETRLARVFMPMPDGSVMMRVAVETQASRPFVSSSALMTSLMASTSSNAFESQSVPYGYTDAISSSVTNADDLPAVNTPRLSASSHTLTASMQQQQVTVPEIGATEDYDSYMMFDAM